MEKTIYQKLDEAREYIHSLKLKKEGRNSYSDYDYFTPEQISRVTQETAHKFKMLPVFNLFRDELGETGVLIIHDLEAKGEIQFTMATAIPEIKATNATQQIGGAMTYTERYLLMTAFKISDNSLDPDTTHRTKETVESAPEKKWLNKWSDKEHTKESTMYWKIVESAKSKGMSVKDLEQHYKISEEIKKELKNDLT